MASNILLIKEVSSFYYKAKIFCKRRLSFSILNSKYYLILLDKDIFTGKETANFILLYYIYFNVIEAVKSKKLLLKIKTLALLFE